MARKCSHAASARARVSSSTNHEPPAGSSTRPMWDSSNSSSWVLEESHIGRGLDPAGGSWFVEELTRALADAAWEHFRAIEAKGGFADAGDYVAAQIAAVREQRADDIAHRRTALTGVNEYPNLSEAPLSQPDSPAGVHRYAAAFEALRDRSD